MVKFKFQPLHPLPAPHPTCMSAANSGKSRTLIKYSLSFECGGVSQVESHGSLPPNIKCQIRKWKKLKNLKYKMSTRKWKVISKHTFSTVRLTVRGVIWWKYIFKIRNHLFRQFLCVQSNGKEIFREWSEWKIKLNRTPRVILFDFLLPDSINRARTEEL